MCRLTGAFFAYDLKDRRNLINKMSALVCLAFLISAGGCTMGNKNVIYAELPPLSPDAEVKIYHFSFAQYDSLDFQYSDPLVGSAIDSVKVTPSVTPEFGYSKSDGLIKMPENRSEEIDHTIPKMKEFPLLIEVADLDIYFENDHKLMEIARELGANMVFIEDMDAVSTYYSENSYGFGGILCRVKLVAKK